MRMSRGSRSWGGARPRACGARAASPLPADADPTATLDAARPRSGPRGRPTQTSCACRDGSAASGRAGAAQLFEVPGMDVHAGHALLVEHGDGATIVLEREAQFESGGSQLSHDSPLEMEGGLVVAVVAHD